MMSVRDRPPPAAALPPAAGADPSVAAAVVPVQQNGSYTSQLKFTLMYGRFDQQGVKAHT